MSCGLDLGHLIVIQDFICHLPVSRQGGQVSILFGSRRVDEMMLSIDRECLERAYLLSLCSYGKSSRVGHSLEMV